jgi:LacI family transcriptional regulator
MIDSYVYQHGICNVGIEDFQGSKQATNYLINKGHKNIAYASLHIQQDGGVLMERFLGYKAALTENQIPFNPKYIFECGLDKEHTNEICEELIAHPEITAVVTTSDLLAANIMVNLTSRGVKIPEDISIIGYDDLNICKLVTPTLTTVHQNMEEKGIAAVDFMLRMLNKEYIKDTTYTIPTHIVERNSVRSL